MAFYKLERGKFPGTNQAHPLISDNFQSLRHLVSIDSAHEGRVLLGPDFNIPWGSGASPSGTGYLVGQQHIPALNETLHCQPDEIMAIAVVSAFCSVLCTAFK